MIMRSGFKAGALAMTGALLAGTALMTTSAEAQTELRLHTFVGPGHIIFREILQPWAAQVEEESGGELKITLYPSMQLGGGAPELIRGTQEGTWDMAFSLPGYTSAQFPRTQMLELPGLAEDGIAATRLMWDLIEGGHLEPEYENLKILALWAADDAGLYTRDTPIRGLDDVQGMILRSPSAGQATQLEKMGATPVAMAITELYPQLERGVIDGVFTSACVGGAMELWRDAPHVQDWGIGPVTGWAILVSEEVWEGLPDDIQEQLREAMSELERDAFSQYEAFVQAALDKMDEGGAELWTAPAEERARVLQPEYSQAAYDSWYARAGEIGVDGQAYIEKVRGALGK